MFASCEEALRAAQAEYDAAMEHGIEGPNSALYLAPEELKQRRQHFESLSKNVMASVDKVIREQKPTHDSDAMDSRAADPAPVGLDATDVSEFWYKVQKNDFRYVKH